MRPVCDNWWGVISATIISGHQNTAISVSARFMCSCHSLSHTHELWYKVLFFQVPIAQYIKVLFNFHLQPHYLWLFNCRVEDVFIWAEPIEFHERSIDKVGRINARRANSLPIDTAAHCSYPTAICTCLKNPLSLSKQFLFENGVQYWSANIKIKRYCKADTDHCLSFWRTFVSCLHPRWILGSPSGTHLRTRYLYPCPCWPGEDSPRRNKQCQNEVFALSPVNRCHI